MCGPHFFFFLPIHLSIVLGCFLLLTTVNNAAMNTLCRYPFKSSFQFAQLSPRDALLPTVPSCSRAKYSEGKKLISHVVGFRIKS